MRLCRGCHLKSWSLKLQILFMEINSASFQLLEAEGTNLSQKQPGADCVNESAWPQRWWRSTERSLASALLHEKHRINGKEQIPQKRQEVSSTSPWNREHGTQTEMWLKQQTTYRLDLIFCWNSLDLAKNFLVTVLIYRNQKLFIKTYCLWKKHVVKMIYQCIISRAIIMTVNLLPLFIVNPLPKLCSLKHAEYLQWRVPGCSPNNKDSCRGRHAPL